MPPVKRNVGAVFALKYHLVWCSKYRKAVLVGDVAARLGWYGLSIGRDMNAAQNILKRALADAKGLGWSPQTPTVDLSPRVSHAVA